jgi:hypothetical protein
VDEVAHRARGAGWFVGQPRPLVRLRGQFPDAAATYLLVYVRPRHPCHRGVDEFHRACGRLPVKKRRVAPLEFPPGTQSRGGKAEPAVDAALTRAQASQRLTTS